MDKAWRELSDLAQDEEDVIAYALFPKVARSFLERRSRGSDGMEPIVAAIAGLLVEAADEQRASAATDDGRAQSPWKAGWRPGSGRWTGLLDGAGGMR